MRRLVLAFAGRHTTLLEISFKRSELRMRLANMLKSSSDFSQTVPRRYFFCRSFFFFLVISCLCCFVFSFVMMSCLFLAALISPSVKELASWLFGVLCFCDLSLYRQVLFLIVSIPDICLYYIPLLYTYN